MHEGRTFRGSKFLTVWTNVAGMSAAIVLVQQADRNLIRVYIDKVVTETKSSHLNLIKSYKQLSAVRH